MAIHYAMMPIVGKVKRTPIPLACGKVTKAGVSSVKMTREPAKVSCRICLSHLSKRGVV